MNWLVSIGVGLCAAPLVGLIVGTLAAVWVDWIRVPQREGAAGVFVVGVTLLGILVGLIAGIAFARGLFQSAPTFAKSLGLALASCSAVALLATGIIRLLSDLPPTIDGQPIEIAIQLRCPSDITLPPADDTSLAYAAFVRLSDGSTSGFAGLQLNDVWEEDGHQIVPALLRLDTSAARKLLSVRVGEHEAMFELGFKSTPHAEDFEWSDWINAAHKLGTQPAPVSAFALRYQARKVPPPPPPLTREQEDAAREAQQKDAMRALSSDAPLAQWLVFTRYGASPAQLETATKAILARPHFVADMTHEILHGDFESSHDALRVIEHLQPAATELAEPIATVGTQIAQAIRELDPKRPGPDETYVYGADISTRFSAWMVATRALQGKNGVDFVPQLQAIIAPARERQTSHTIRIDIVRVASYYLQQWAAIEPLPSDPPPR